MFFSISLMAIYVVQIGTNKIQMKTNEINKTKRYPTSKNVSPELIQKQVV